jgi:hypothetical protein
MSYRFSLNIYILAVVWICSISGRSKLNLGLIVFLISLHIWLSLQHKEIIQVLGKDAQSIHIAGEYIDENKVLLPVNLTNHWLEGHFSNYLGVDKPMIILENYEANVGWFPVRWNSEGFPNLRLADKNSVNGIKWKTNIESSDIQQIDNILLYGKTELISNSEWNELREIITDHFILVYKSDNNFVMLYEYADK